MTRRSSNKRNRKAKTKRVPSKSQTSTSSSSTDARDDDNPSGSQSLAHNFQDSDSTPSPSGVPSGNARQRKVPVQQPENMDVDEDPTPPAPSTSKTRGGGRGGRAKQAPQTDPVEGEMSLFKAVFNGKSSLESVINEWIETYETNKDEGLRIMMQFFLEASGCKGRITPAMQNLEHVQLIKRMNEEFDEEDADYPIVKAGPKFKKFKMNYCNFVEIWVYQSENTFLYDSFLMDNIISWLVGLSNTQVRAFRHTTTLAAMKIMSTLADLANMVALDLDDARTKYDAESQGERNADRMESLITQTNKLEKNLDELKTMLAYIFKSVFIHRFRDIVPEIRANCIEEIGVCMITFPQMFLGDTYLKYIGWLLHDSIGEVRLKCLQALQPLYDKEEWKNQLQDFTKRFKERIQAMILDKEFDVEEQAIKLVISMNKYGHAIMDEKDCECLFELIYCSNRAVAQAAGRFVNEKVFTSNENVEVVTKSGKKRLPNTPFIKDLIMFSIESELPEYEPFLVDSLMEINEIMKDWECMTDLLLEEPGPNEIENLDSEKETILIKIMVCCIKQVATGEPPDGRGSARKVPKEKKRGQDDKQKMTEHFVGVLPLLLEKYRDDPKKLPNLMSIPRYFELSIYSSEGQEQNLDLLMNKITEIVDVTLDPQVLDEAAKTLDYMCGPESPIVEKCDEIILNLINLIISKYTEAIEKVRSAIEDKYTPSEVDVFTVQESLTKIACFFSCHNLNTAADMWDSLFKNIRDRVLPDEAIKYSITACFFSINWSRIELTESADDNHVPDEKRKTLKNRLRDFMKYVSRLIGADEVSTLIKDEAFCSVCDLLVIFNSNLTEHPNSQLQQLIYEPDTDLQKVLNKFVQQRVFSDMDGQDLDEQFKTEELHKRRNFLAAYCKLIILNIMSADAVVDVFKHYVEYGEIYGDVIKATISKTRNVNKTKCALALQRSLNILYEEIAEGKEKVDKSSDEFKSVKELAKRFALFFGNDAKKNRDAMTALHKRGIMFAASMPNKIVYRVPPPNLSYLEILNEFTNKLLNQDKKTILIFLRKHLKEGVPERDWESLTLYRKRLERDKADATAVDLSVSL